MVEVPVGNPLHELLRRQGEEHAVGGDGDHRRCVHDLLPVADAGHSSGTDRDGSSTRMVSYAQACSRGKEKQDEPTYLAKLPPYTPRYVCTASKVWSWSFDVFFSTM